MQLESIKTRGVEVDGRRLRQLRRSRGLTQDDLALLAGVGERTVRNAEAGRRIQCDFLRFLAIALGVEASDLAAETGSLRIVAREENNVAHILRAIRAFAFDRDLGEYQSLLSHDVLIRLPGPSAVPFVGEYRGMDGLQTLLERSQASVVHDEGLKVTEIRASGNLVLFQFADSGRAVATGRRWSCWCQHIYEFEKGRVIRADSQFDTEPVLRAFM